MSSKEIIESQMTEMRNKIAEDNKQVGQIVACLDIMGKIVDKFSDGAGDGQYVYTQQQYSSMIRLLHLMSTACKRV